MRRLSIAVMTAATIVAFSQIAMSADMPTKVPASKAPVAVAPSWTGFYAGLNAGYGWKNDDTAPLTGDGGGLGSLIIAASSSPQATNSPSGFIGGGQLGYSWQISTIALAGIEADIQYSHVRDSNISFNQLPSFGGSPVTPIPSSHDLKWFGTLRGRLGIVAADRLLFFVTGGLAYGGVDASASFNLSPPFGGIGGGGTTVTCIGQVCYAGSSCRTAAGWTIGGGVEYLYTNNWSLKAEYLYMDLGSHDVVMLPLSILAGGPTSMTAHFQDRFNIVRVGLNYKFGG